MKGNIYFDKILMGAPFKVEELGAKFGKGAVCTRHIAADESFFTETPFAIQARPAPLTSLSLWNYSHGFI